MNISFAKDSLKYFMDFCKLVQLSLDELKQLEQLEDEMAELSCSETDSMLVSEYNKY